MNIQKSSSVQSFGKIPVMYCNVKRADNKKKTGATVYQMNVFDNRDIKDVKYSKTALCLMMDMLEDRYNNSYPDKEYFIMTDDRTGEVISCAATSNHMRVSNGKISGKYLLVEEFNKNKKYIWATAPMFAFLAGKAYNSGLSNIVIGTSNIDEQSLHKSHFTRTKEGEWVMNQRKFPNIIDIAQKKFDISI